MSTLIVEQLETTISQVITFNPLQRRVISGVRPLLYMHNTPAGTFTLSLKFGGNTLVSKDFTSAEIQSDLETADPYAYLWKRIVFDEAVQIEFGEYELELSSSGYTFSGGAWLGWVKEYEDRTVEPTDTIINDLDNPHSYQLFEYTESI